VKKTHILSDISVKQAILIISYTIYALLYAECIDTKGNFFLLFMSVISIHTLLYEMPPLHFIRSIIKIFLVFFGLSILTAISNLWSHGNSNWVFASANKFLFCSLIVSSFANNISTKKLVLQITIICCCICLSIFMIAQNSGLDLKNLLTKFSLQVVNGDWNEKYHSFWLVFLAWTSFFSASSCFSKRKARLINLLILFYTTFALFTSYSDSAKLAWIISLCIFLFSKFNVKLIWNSIILFTVFYIITFPLIWQLLPAPVWEWTYSIHERTFIRFLLLETASNAILDNWFLGHGFGSSLSLSITPYLPELSNYNINLERLMWVKHGNLFPGGHPHNIIALIWLDWGFIGALLVSLLVYKSFLWLTPIVEIQQKGLFINSLLISALVIFSLSFSTWQTDVVMTYAMLIVALMVVIKSPDETVCSEKDCQN